MASHFDIQIEAAPREFRRQYRLSVARRQQLLGLPIVAGLLAVLAMGSLIIESDLTYRQIAPLFFASLAIGVFVLFSRELTDNQFSYSLAFTFFCILEPMLLIQEIASNQYLYLINHVVAITFTSLSISWRTMLIGLFLLTIADLVLHQTVLNVSNPSSIQLLFSNISILLGAFILAVRIQTVHSQADLAFAIDAMAHTDPLTGIGNRRAIARYISETLIAKGSPLVTITYLDINNLKKINDEFGHQCGDSAIRLVAETLQSTLGENQFAARIGGDEFLIVGGENLVEREKTMKSFQEEIKSRSQRDLNLLVTISCGSRSAESSAAEISELIKDADEAQYRNKSL